MERDDSFVVDRQGRKAVISLQGHFEAATILKLKSVINSLLEDGALEFVLDLKKVMTINSTAIGLLLTCLKTIRSKSGTLRMKNLGREIVRTFTIMGADKIFEIDEAAE
jgi:anti-anti-sigma factor